MDAIDEVVELAEEWADDGTTTPKVVYVLMNEALERTRRLCQMTYLLKHEREAVAQARASMQKEIDSLKAKLEAALESVAEGKQGQTMFPVPIDSLVH